MKIELDEIMSLYEAGRFVTAYECLRPHGGLAALEGSKGQALAGRLANNLGGERYGRALHWKAWRKEPNAESLGFFVGLAMAQLRGPVAALDFLESLPVAELSDLGRSDLLSARACMLTWLRDFDRAELALKEALKIQPERVWLFVCRGQWQAGQDRPQEALADYQEALKRRPHYRPAVQAVASALTTLDRMDEARELLIDAAAHLESGTVLLQLAHLERELGEHESARARMRTAERLLPLMHLDREFKKGFLGFESDLAYRCGEIDESIELARAADTKFHRTIVANLEKHRETGKRVVLPVGFTLQHHVTCAPATISSLTRYWEQPLEHLEIAETICYDGTPAHAERELLEQQGFYCREFTETWETAQKLIDAGIPFAHSLSGFGMGHMQAVIGYDSRRGVLIIRDSNYRHSSEALAEELLEKMRSSGPRGLAFVPAKERDRLEALELPDEELWDAHYHVTRSLEKHQHELARKHLQRMEQLAPDHRLTIYARAQLAWYDGDRQLLRDCTDTLLERFPNDQNQWSHKLGLLRENGTRAARLEVLEKLSENPECGAVFRQQYLEELVDDANERDNVQYLLRRTLHQGAVSARLFTLQGGVCWRELKRSQALQWYRFAACLEDKDEHCAMTYFFAARALNRTDEVLEMLHDRFKRFKHLNSGPGRSLAETYDQLNQPHRSVEILEESLAARPADGELKLFATSFLSRIGRTEQAEHHLNEARSLCRKSDWALAAARFAWGENRLEEAQEHLSQILAAEPFHLSAHRLASEVTADLQGDAAAVEELEKFVDRFPESQYLRLQLVEISSPLGPEKVEAEVREFLKLHPQNPWAWRELGFRLVEQRRWQEALEAAKKAHELDPTAEQVYFLLGLLFRGAGQLDKARTYMLRAVRTSADCAPAIIELVRLCETKADRRQALEQVLVELKKQVTHGEGLMAFRDLAARAFEPPEVLRLLLEARKSRPDLWQIWSALVRQLLAMRRMEDALKTARDAAVRFPLSVPVLLDLADVYLELRQPDAERESIDRALAVGSRNGLVLRRSAEAYRRAGNAEEERAALERACASEPREITHRGALAEFLWNQGNREEAITAIGEALQRDPDYEWGWNQFTTWTAIIGRPQQVLGLVSSITEKRTNSPQAWLRKARILSEFPEQYEQQLAALDRAIELDPRLVEPYDLKATALAEHGDFDRALATCSPPALRKRNSLHLAMRAAIIHRQRGESSAAIDMMRDVVTQDPHRARAWAWLTDWYREDGDHEESLRCAKRVLENSPDAAASWGYAADAYFAVENRDEARKHLERAVELDPSYLYGGRYLIWIDTEDKRYDEALATLARIGPYLSADERYAQETKLQTLAGRLAQARRAFVECCRSSVQAENHLEIACDSLLRAGQSEHVKEALLSACELADHHAKVGSALANVYAQEGAVSTLYEICDWLDPESATWATATGAFAVALGDARLTGKLTTFVNRYGETLRKHDGAWAAVGSALQGCNAPRDIVTWMHDWRERTRLEAYMLGPLAWANVALCQAEEAREVADAAAKLPVSYATDSLRLLGVLGCVVDNSPEEGLKRLAAITPANLSSYYSALYEISKCALTLSDFNSNGRWSQDGKTWKNTVTHNSQNANDDFAKRVISRCEWMLAINRRTVVHTWAKRFEIWKLDRRAKHVPIVGESNGHPRKSLASSSQS